MKDPAEINNSTTYDNVMYETATDAILLERMFWIEWHNYIIAQCIYFAKFHAIMFRVLVTSQFHPPSLHQHSIYRVLHYRCVLIELRCLLQ